MLAFADLIHPIAPEAFFANWYGRKPLHIPASDARRRVLDWPGLNAMLSAKDRWTEAHLKLFLDARRIPAEDYCDRVTTLDGPRLRASPAKVKLYLSVGASLVANLIENQTPELRAVARALEEELVGHTVANLYCSFSGLKAFETHYDAHEVFALHTEGEKVWRIWEGREDRPLAAAGGMLEAPRDPVQARGKLLTEVTMRPGDLLYIPRGQYHDALASSDASLHVTFSVEPMTGKNLFRLLEAEAGGDPAFREWLPREGGAALRERLGELAERVTRLMTSEAFAQEVEQRRRSGVGERVEYDLPDVRPMQGWDVIGRAELAREPEGWVLVTTGRRIAIPGLGEPAAWILKRDVFGTEELQAWHPSHAPEALAGLIDTLAAAGVVRRRP